MEGRKQVIDSPGIVFQHCSGKGNKDNRYASSDIHHLKMLVVNYSFRRGKQRHSLGPVFRRVPTARRGKIISGNRCQDFNEEILEA